MGDPIRNPCTEGVGESEGEREPPSTTIGGGRPVPCKPPTVEAEGQEASTSPTRARSPAGDAEKESSEGHPPPGNVSLK
ncbi:hypothetical protein SUGI_0698640 [Cryptomeria japonica]|nr:hypothetical protein SUGI_0698640 [Cryptomeria japonica]